MINIIFERVYVPPYFFPQIAEKKNLEHNISSIEKVLDKFHSIKRKLWKLNMEPLCSTYKSSRIIVEVNDSGAKLETLYLYGSLGKPNEYWAKREREGEREDNRRPAGL